MHDPFVNMDDVMKHLLDAASLLTVVGTLIDMLPSVAAVFTIVWTGIRIYETETVQRLLGRTRAREENVDAS